MRPHFLPTPLLRFLGLSMVVFGLSLLAVAPVTAKEGFEARLDAPISIDSAPGTMLSVGWSVFMLVDGEEMPMYGTPVMIRLLPRGGGAAVMVLGTERPSASGHYVADIVVPASGIGGIEIGLHGEMCESGVCSTSDMLFHLNGPTLVGSDVAGVVVGVAPAASAAIAAAPAVEAAPAATSAVVAPAVTALVAAAPTSVDIDLAGIMVVLGVAAIATVAIGWAIQRRRRRLAGASTPS